MLQATDLVTEGQQLVGVELGDGGLENLITDGGQDTFVVVEAQTTVHRWKVVDIGLREHSKRDADDLHVLRSRRGADAARAGSHIVDDGVLQERHQEVSALGNNVVFDSDEAVEDDGAVTSLDCKAQMCQPTWNRSMRGDKPLYIDCCIKVAAAPRPIAAPASLPTAPARRRDIISTNRRVEFATHWLDKDDQEAVNRLAVRFSLRRSAWKTSCAFRDALRTGCNSPPPVTQLQADPH